MDNAKVPAEGSWKLFVQALARPQADAASALVPVTNHERAEGAVSGKDMVDGNIKPQHFHP